MSGSLLHAGMFLAAAVAAMAVVMAAGWVVQRRLRDAGVVDFLWSAGVGATVVAGALVLEGPPQRRLLVAALAGLWSARLAWHLLRDRVLPEGEDGRYQELRHRWGDRFEGRIFLFFQAQGLLAAPRPALGPLDALGAVVWLVGVGGEALADRQLARWRADPATRGRTCRAGLWRYSRHPNYFFEWLHWFAYPLVGWGAAWWWIPAAAPLVMLVFIVGVTGIPPTEARALASRGEDYRRYQRETSAFIPWFPRTSAGDGDGRS